MTVVPVDEASRVGEARRLAVAEAARIGLPAEARERAALLATECASNLLHHATQGEIVIRATEGPPPRLDVIAMDSGPGIPSVERAMADGFTTLGPGRVGAGLGAMRRLGDRFDIHSDPQGTTVVTGVGDAPDAEIADGFVLAKPGESVSGDAWAVRRTRDARVALLVDALGHGANAARAADAAVAAFLGASGERLEELVEASFGALQDERGAAALFFAAPLAEPGTARAVGVGNIRGELLNGEARSGVVSNPGVAGRGDRRRAPLDYPWTPTSLLVLTTDGLREGGREGVSPALRARAPLTIAATLMKRRRRGGDDAGVLVLKGGAS